MNLQQYISETEKQYRLRLKTVVPLDDDAMDKVERAVDKFQPIEITRPVKTILQKHPLDFQGVENAEVFIVDMCFVLPVAAHTLRADIRKALKAPEEFVMVREINDPTEVETLRLDAIADIEEEAKKLGLTPTGLLGSPEYPEVEEVDGADFYGDKYNATFLSYLRDVQTSREERRVNPSSPLFDYLGLPDRKDQEPVQSDEDYNATIPDAPRVIPTKSTKGPKVAGNLQGTKSDEEQYVKRVYTDSKGKRVVLSRKLGGKE